MLLKNNSINNNIVIITIAILYTIHLILVSQYTIEFPNFGDDLYLMKFIPNYDYQHFQFSTFYYPFHGGIHVNLLNKLVLLILYTIEGIINYKHAILTANLIYLIIIYYFLKLFKEIELKPIYQICFFLLFFSLKGNLDNFNLIGIMQHGLGTFVFLAVLSYLITIKKNYPLAILLGNFCLATVSIEIIGVLLVANFYSLIFKDRYRLILLLLTIVNISLYYFGIKYSEQLLQLQSFNITISINTFYGIFIFLGGIISNFKLAFIIGFIISATIIVYFFNLKGSFKDKLLNEKMFPLILFAGILANAILVQLGRNVNNDPNAQFFTAVAIRFSLFHLYVLLIFFLICLDILQNIPLKENLRRYFPFLLLLLFSTYYLFNYLNFANFLVREKDRMLVDSYNVYKNFESTYYKLDYNFSKELANNPNIKQPNFEIIETLKLQEKTNVLDFENDGTYTNIYFQNTQKYHFATINNAQNKPTLFSINDTKSGKSEIKIGNFWLLENRINLKQANIIQLMK